MHFCRNYYFILWQLFVCLSFSVSANDEGTSEPRFVTLLFTNDIESAYEPTLAYWRDDLHKIGGISELASLIDQIRANEPRVFLFDAGDIFTGTLSKRTRGELPFELMMSMSYDAMCIGNHEFEYGWMELARQKNRVAFPVLGANLFYKGTDHPFAQPYAIVERAGVRIGVIGVLGQDAATSLIPANIAGVDVRDPAIYVSRYVQKLRASVDLIVLLTHQGKTAPMQTDDEAHPEIQRDIQADIDLAGVVDGIDVLFAGHADAGTRKPVVHPETGTLIMQTFGQGYHLGYLKVELDDNRGGIASYEGKLIPVDSEALAKHPAIECKLSLYRGQHPDLFENAGHVSQRLSRDYNAESDLGNLFADIVRQQMQADVGLMPSGALRRDLAQGTVRQVDLLDAFPFTDRVASLELSGAVLLEVIEQGLSLERGVLQVSGLEVHYNPQALPGRRINSIKVNGQALVSKALYRVATVEILAQGGDKYVQFKRAEKLEFARDSFSKILLTYFASRNTVFTPVRGRLIAD